MAQSISAGSLDTNFVLDYYRSTHEDFHELRMVVVPPCPSSIDTPNVSVTSSSKDICSLRSFSCRGEATPYRRLPPSASPSSLPLAHHDVLHHIFKAVYGDFTSGLERPASSRARVAISTHA